MNVFIALLFLTTSTITPLQERVKAHLILSNPQAALQEVTTALQTNPNDKELEELRLVLLCRLFDESALLNNWKKFKEKYPKEAEAPFLLEEISWMTITKSLQDASPHIRMEAAMAAAYSQDAKGIPLIVELLSDQNVGLRLFGLYLSERLRDAVIEQKVIELFTKDSSPYVRFAAIETIGKLRAKKAIPLLKKRLEVSETTPEEKQLLISCLTALEETHTITTVKNLLQSPNENVRMLGCKIIAVEEMNDAIFLLKPLLQDTSYEVQCVALQTLAALHAQLTKEDSVILHELLSSHEPQVAILASFLLITSEQDIQAGQTHLNKWLEYPNDDVRHFAAGCLAHTGTRLLEFSADTLHTTTDPLIKINLACHLITERYELSLATQSLTRALHDVKARLDFTTKGFFQYVTISKATHLAMIPRYPEARDLACRLELYGRLATCQPPHLEVALASFLKERAWGISAMAAELLIQESSDNAIGIIKKLLNSNLLEVRLQAAFILALTTQDEEALEIIHVSYAKAPRELKEELLLGCRAVGSKKSLPFLCSVLDEPSTILRLRASSAILAVLNK